jgi:uncharacterized protein DUF4407
MSNQNTPDVLLRVCCAITGTDPELVMQCAGVLERRRIILHAAGLVASFTITVILWSLVFSLMLPLWGAILGGIIMAVVIYMLDLAISTSDWDQKGILAGPMTFRRAPMWLLMRILRFGFALVFAMVTGLFVTLWSFNESVEFHLHKNRLADNAPIESEYRVARELLHAEIVVPVHRAHKAIVEERSKLLKRLDQLQTTLQENENAASHARIEMNRELEGLNRQAGEGPRYKDAKTRFEETGRHIVRVQKDINRDTARLTELDDRVAAIKEEIREANSIFEARNTVLMAERDAKLMPARTDYLKRLTALEQLKDDEIHGRAVTQFALIVKIFLVVLEMIYFSIAIVFGHASVYITRLNLRTRMEDRRAKFEYEQANRQLEAAFGVMENSQTAGYRDQAVRHSSGDDNTDEKPLFDPAPETDSAVTDNESSGANHAPGDAPTCEDERYLVIGGAPDEFVTKSEALADRNLYWVNPDRPDEIWARQFHDELQRTAGGQSA